MQARGRKMHPESLTLAAVQVIKRRSPAPRGPGSPRNANQTHPNKTHPTRGSQRDERGVDLHACISALAAVARTSSSEMPHASESHNARSVAARACCSIVALAGRARLQIPARAARLSRWPVGPHAAHWLHSPARSHAARRPRCSVRPPPAPKYIRPGREWWARENKVKEIGRRYSLRPKISAILELGTQTNVRCEMTKLPLVFYENDLNISLSFVWEASRASCLLW
jgi:hypothetical protein